jgi:phytoene dehydrogenase-like protein
VGYSIPLFDAAPILQTGRRPQRIPEPHLKPSAPLPLQPSPTRPDAVDATVVGSGPNGLSAAIALAQTGRKVRLIEAESQIGGGLRSGPLQETGFVHDHCSAIHPMGLSSPFWRTLPLADHGLRWVDPPAPFGHAFIGEPAALAERDLRRSAAALGEDPTEWGRAWGPLIERWPELCADAFGRPGLPSSPILLSRMGIRTLLPASWYARIAFRGPRAQALFAGAAAHSVLPLGRSPSAAIGLMLHLAAHAVGWPFPQGGSSALAEALASLFLSLGGEIHVNRKVEHIDELGSGLLFFDTGPMAMAQICGDHLPSAYRNRLSRYRYGPGLCKVDWTLNGPIPWSDPQLLRTATVHVGGHLDEVVTAEAAPWRGEVARQPFLILVQPSLFDATRAPPDRHTAWAYCHVPAGDPRDHTQLIEERVEAFAPGFRDQIRTRFTRTATDLQRMNPNYVGGDVNGGAADWDQLFTRPVARLSPYSTPNPRIFLCSASTPPGGGVHGMGGYNAVQAALSAGPSKGIGRRPQISLNQNISRPQSTEKPAEA